MNRNQLINMTMFFEDMDFKPRSYSGRNMYGRECFGVVIPRDTNMLKLGFDLAKTLLEDESFDIDDLDYKTDSMGKDTIIYFPDIDPPVKQSNIEDDESED